MTFQVACYFWNKMYKLNNSEPPNSQKLSKTICFRHLPNCFLFLLLLLLMFVNVCVWVLWFYLCNAIYFSPKDNKCFGRAPDEAKFPHFISAGSASSFSTWLRFSVIPPTTRQSWGKLSQNSGGLARAKKMHFTRGNLCDLWVHLNSFWRWFSKIWLDISKFWLFWWIMITS